MLDLGQLWHVPSDHRGAAQTHAQPATTARYWRLFDDPLRAAKPTRRRYCDGQAEGHGRVAERRCGMTSALDELVSAIPPAQADWMSAWSVDPEMRGLCGRVHRQEAQWLLARAFSEGLIETRLAADRETGEVVEIRANKWKNWPAKEHNFHDVEMRGVFNMNSGYNRSHRNL